MSNPKEGQRWRRNSSTPLYKIPFHYLALAILGTNVIPFCIHMIPKAAFFKLVSDLLSAIFPSPKSLGRRQWRFVQPVFHHKQWVVAARFTVGRKSGLASLVTAFFCLLQTFGPCCCQIFLYYGPSVVCNTEELAHRSKSNSSLKSGILFG